MEETPDANGAFPRLNDAQIELLSEYGGVHQRTHVGDVLCRTGESWPGFLVILTGQIAVVDRPAEEAAGGPGDREAGDGKAGDRDGQGGRPGLVTVHGPRRFLGELGLLTGQRSFVTAVVHEAGEVLAVPVDGLRELIACDPPLGDLILRAYVIRRSMLIGSGTGLRIVGSRFSADSRRLLEFAARNRLPHRWIDLEDDPSGETLLRHFGIAPQDAPVVVWGAERVLRNPSNAELAQAVGLTTPASPPDTDLLVVGAGPAGLAAAVYGASDGLTTMVVDAVATGGQAGTSPRIENYLGFPAGIAGADLTDRATLQADRFGARVRIPAKAVDLERRDGLLVVGLADGEPVRARCLIIATGARYRRLDVPCLQRFEGTSVFYAATVIEAQACHPGPVVVVGGGNSAGQAALFLARHGSRVTLLLRGGELTAKMSLYLVEQIERAETIEVRRHTIVREACGDGTLRAVVTEDNRTGERETVPARALFVFIGAVPHTGWLARHLELDERGFVRTGPGTPLETSWRGVFAAGDVRSGSVKRVASAVGEGAMAVQMVHRHLARTG
ncbi:FAD-dependent oxidoreductase [Actinomadura nitritigenes]|uniref:FAD-dependent oxidoreductase n=1 Tax=Actinomadura nitritigenes TaxID=134602 RepID=UPI0027DCAB5A|nr:FAD-dependent oxidoreductase [Actinomadura nitritigenes]